MKKLDASRIQLNFEKLLISFESLRLPSAISRTRKNVSRLEVDANSAKLVTMFSLASRMVGVSKASFRIWLHLFMSIRASV